MNKQEIDEQIRIAVQYKHQNDISKALEIEEGCLERCIDETETSWEDFALILKALGKLYILDHQLMMAKLHLSAALQYYIGLTINNSSNESISLIYQNEMMNCAFWLGCCNKKFLESKLGKEEYDGLMYGGTQSSMTQNDIEKRVKSGNKIYEQIFKQKPGKSPAERILDGTY